MKILLALILALASVSPFEFDKTVHDFGSISLKDGPVTCTFTLTNNSQEPLSIFSVISSCGCTDVTWPREAIEPGDSAQISITYSNDQGAYPFDKTLTVYTSAQKKPVILHVKGVVTK